MSDEIIVEEKLINDDIKSETINLTTINVEGIQKVANKKVSFQKKAINIILSSLILGGAAFGGYKIYEAVKRGQEAYNAIPTVEEIMQDKNDAAIDELKEQYGMGYYFYEPLTDEQINEQFQAIMKYIPKMWDKTEKLDMEIGFYDQDGCFYLRGHTYNIKTYEEDLRAKYVAPALKDHLEWYKYYNATSKSPWFDSYDLTVYLQRGNAATNIDILSMELKEAYVRFWKFKAAAIREAVIKYKMEAEYEEYNPELLDGELFTYENLRIYTI
jgi:hypothetical protein